MAAAEPRPARPSVRRSDVARWTPAPPCSPPILLRIAPPQGVRALRPKTGQRPSHPSNLTDIHVLPSAGNHNPLIRQGLAFVDPRTLEPSLRCAARAVLVFLPQTDPRGSPLGKEGRHTRTVRPHREMLKGAVGQPRVEWNLPSAESAPTFGGPSARPLHPITGVLRRPVRSPCSSRTIRWNGRKRPHDA